MRYFRGLLSPWGCTNRIHYWLIIVASALMLVGVWSAKNETGGAIVLAVIIAAQLVDLIATARRLHDAGWSRWWLALYLFPMTITWDFVHFQLGSSTWSVVDISAAIRLIPVVIGLLAPSRTTVDGAIAQPA